MLNRRALPRLGAVPAAGCFVFTLRSATACPAVIRDASAVGLGLSLRVPVEPGAFVTVALYPAQPGSPCLVSGHVAHCTRQAEGTHHVGVRLTRGLGPAELFALLGQSAEPHGE